VLAPCSSSSRRLHDLDPDALIAWLPYSLDLSHECESEIEEINRPQRFE